MTPPSLATDANVALQACRRELAEALEQHAATREILGVISRLPADPQPVFEAIVAAGVRLFGDAAVAISRPDGNMVRLLAIAEADSERKQRWARVFPFPLSREYIHGAALLDCRVIDVPDMLEPGGPLDVGKRNVAPAGYRAVAVVPLVREGQAVGAIAVVRVRPGRLSERQLALLQTFADQALIAIENARLFNEREARNRELAEALEQQTATGEILRTIARSPADTQPVFDAIVQRSVRLCGAQFAFVMRRSGDRLELAARTQCSDEFAAYLDRGYPIDRTTTSGRAATERHTVQVLDFQAEAGMGVLPPHRSEGVRTVLAVPLLRNDELLGVIGVWRREVQAFPPNRVVLLENFADQAVIAIENARLFHEREARNRELAEALEQQTATGEILRVIARSPTDVQPVFDTIAAAARRLCQARAANVVLLEGGQLQLVAEAVEEPRGLAALHIFPRPVGRDTAAGRAVLERQVVEVRDVLADAEYGVGAGAVKAGFRSALGVPLLRDGVPLGAIVLGRREPGALPPALVGLLRTFADQAVIALENVRLFNERETRNRELAEALDQQTATSEILRVISRSPTDVQPVFDAIAAAARALFKSRSANVFTFDGRLVHAAAVTVTDPEGRQAVQRAFPRAPGRDLAAPRAILTRALVEIPDVREDPDFLEQQIATAANFRSVLAVPLLRNGDPVGAIAIGRPEPGRFAPQLVALMQTFADQAVIAIENTRLFTALQDKTRELEIASRHKSAFLANTSHELRTPLNAILGFTRIVLRETRGQIAPKQAENLEKILSSARHLVGVINATLDLTRIEAGRIEITPSELALAPLLDECLRGVEPLAAEGVSLRARAPPDLPPLVVDVEKLHQILLNLLGNAVKFTERGSIELRAAARDSRVVIEVEDTGIGIPADKLEAVFEEFEQVDASHTRAQGGTGLGLAIARRLARAMGGELSAVSALGKGSIFTLDLPWRLKGPDEA